ncbi:hypothetical protein PENTCL1PPCAC_29561, partial [Pristionchus entomophagus]
ESGSLSSMWLSRLTAWLLLVAFHHWVNAQDQNSFSDATSKSIWTLAYYTTSATPETCVPKKSPGWKVLSKVVVPGAPIFGQSQAVISVNEVKKQINIHFRGPDAVTTFILSGYTYLLQSDFPVQPFEGLNVAQEFAKTFTAMWQGGLREATNAAWEEYCDFPILVTGYSVGGCLASMYAVKIKKLGLWDYSTISLYTYSSPRCGYQDFALAVNAAAKERYMVRYNDYVIQLPATTCTSINPANPQNCYWHPGYGLQYAYSLWWGTTGPTRCATAETAGCLAGTILDISNHNGFYSGMSYGLWPPTC